MSLQGEEAVRQLWTTCSNSLQRALHNGGATSLTDPKALMEIIEQLAVKQRNNLVNIVELQNMEQFRDEKILVFSAM